MNKKKGKESSDAESSRVILKPLFGIRPGVYLSILYLGIIILILFFLLFYPGIRRNGSIVRFESTPPGSSVYVDGIRVGATPVETFVPAGEREILFKKPFFKDILLKEEIRGRIFGSLIIPSRMTFHRDIVLEDVSGFFTWKSSEFSSWALAGEMLASYQFPPLLSQTARDYLLAPGNKSPQVLYSFLYSMMKNVNSEALLKDLLRAFSLTTTSGKTAGPLQLLSGLERISRLQNEVKTLPLWLLLSLREEKQEAVESSEWYQHAVADYLNSLQSFPDESLPELPQNTLSAGGIFFLRIPGGSFIMGRGTGRGDRAPGVDTRMLPHPVRVEDLFFSTTEVSNGQFSQFITARPEWAPSNREALTAEGLVTEDYLSHWNGNSVPEELRDLPVTYVSYYAARAYCSWLTEVLPGQFSGYSADLPTEQEWERAALAAESSTGQAVLGRRGDTGPSPISRSDTPLLQDMMGNVWEWCSDWFFPAEYLLLTGEGAAFAEQALFPGAEKSVRGGAWINHPEEIEPTVRGAQPPEWCTPFLGFRPVLRVNP